MADQDPTTEEQTLRRRLMFQSKHRGVKELDLVLGRFAETHLADFDLQALREYAVLLAEQDPDIYDWLVGRAPVPARLQNRVMQLLLVHGTAPR